MYVILKSVLLNSILLCYRYEKYAQKNGWKFDVIDIMESAVKGYKVQHLLVFPNFCLNISYMHMIFHCCQDTVTILRFGNSETLNSYISCCYSCMKEASGTISGPGAFGKLKFESGIHRVQVQ